MKVTLKASTRCFIGNQPVELTADTEVNLVGIADGDYDAAARMLAGANLRVYADHIDSLAHDETVKRKIEEVVREVDLRVTYGARGTRLESIKDTRPPIVPAATPEPADEVQPGPVEPAEPEAAN